MAIRVCMAMALATLVLSTPLGPPDSNALLPDEVDFESTAGPAGDQDLRSSLSHPSLPPWFQDPGRSINHRSGKPIVWNDELNARHFADGPQLDYEFSPLANFKYVDVHAERSRVMTLLRRKKEWRTGDVCLKHHGWDRTRDQGYPKVPSRKKAVKLRTVKLLAGTVLWHMANAKIAFSNRRGTYLTPDVCQSVLHGIPLPGGYLHEVLVTKDINLIDIRSNRYPTQPTTETLPLRPGDPEQPALPLPGAKGGACLQALSSHNNPLNKALVRAVCAWLQSHGLMGWRNREDQNEVFLCEDNGGADLAPGQTPPGPVWPSGRATVARQDAHLQLLRVHALSHKTNECPIDFPTYQKRRARDCTDGQMEFAEVSTNFEGRLSIKRSDGAQLITGLTGKSSFCASQAAAQAGTPDLSFQGAIDKQGLFQCTVTEQTEL